MNKLIRTSFLLIGFLLVGNLVSIAQIRIEAEDYSQMSGIELQTTSDEGGGYNVGWFDGNDWLDYDILIPIEGDYLLDFRVAGEIGGSLKVLNGSDLLQTIPISATGGWQNWVYTGLETSVHFEAGAQVVRLMSVSGGFNLNRFEFTLEDPIDEDIPSSPIITNAIADVHTVSLAWELSNDTSTVVSGYSVMNNEVFIAYTVDTNIILSNLASNSNYSISIVASDIAANKSLPSSVNIKTDSLSWDLLWSDEFDYDGAIDSEKWYFETGGHGWGNGEAQYYTNGENASVADGVLTIEARKESYGGNDFTSSRINSVPAIDFLFGRIEVKAKLPKTNGTWPAIWTLPTDWVYGGWPDCGEFDIMEHSATYNYGHVFGTIHTGAYNHEDGTQKSGGISFDDVTDVYHTYVLEWYPDHADWYIDDTHIFRFDNEYKTTAEWPYDVKHHLLLNVAIGGGLGGDVDYNGVWPQQMIIDYVRVYDFKLGENDTIAPTIPMEVEAEPKWSTVNLTWNLSRDNYAVEKYYIFLNEKLVDSVIGTTAFVQGLEELTSYEVGIQACDYSGNLSEISQLEFATNAIESIVLPGKIKAVDYTFMEGIDTESCDDFDGGENVGWIDNGDWLIYTVEVEQAGEYYAGFRIASQNNSGVLALLSEEGLELAKVNTPITGGWQTWSTVLTESFYLEAGIQQLKVLSEIGGYNLNWINIGDEEFALTLKEDQRQALLVYPNPLFGNELTVVLPEKTDSSLVFILGIDGKKYFEKRILMNGNQLNLEGVDLNSGIYVLSIQTQTTTYVHSITIE